MDGAKQMTEPKKPEPYELTGKELQAYRRGFTDGNQGDYFPGGLGQDAYDRGHADGKKFGSRKGKPWTLAELKNVQ
jgi:hypothetical protein